MDGNNSSAEGEEANTERTDKPESFQLLESDRDDANANLVTGDKTVSLIMRDGDELALVHTKHEMLPEKDFAAEVRAFRDLEVFLKQAVVVLNLPAQDTRDIVGVMVRRLLDNTPKAKDQCTEEEVMTACFAAESDSLVARMIQGTAKNYDAESVDFDQSWICIMCELPRLTQRHTVVARLHQPTNLGVNCQEVIFVILILGPTVEKMTKSSMELGRTYGTLMMDLEFRHALLEATNDDEFKQLMRERAQSLAKHQGLPEHRKSTHVMQSIFDEPEGASRCPFGRGMLGDLKRRLPHYWSDYKDGVIGHKTPHKVAASTMFLYFACVLPNLAFGMLNSSNTDGAIGVKKILFSQMFGGILFAVFGGQPLIVLLTTAPLALYTKIIFSISEDFDLNFNAMFACVGLWNAFFLLIYSFFDVSKLMRWSSRSTEEIFSLFITFAFSVDAIKDTIANFNTNYHTEACHTSAAGNASSNITANTTTTTTTILTTAVQTLMSNFSSTVAGGGGVEGEEGVVSRCLRENSMLFLLLMLGTVWVGITLFNFTKTPYLTAGKREILADYALPIAVLFMSFFGSYVFRDIKLAPFAYNPDEGMFEVAPLMSLPVGAIFAAAGLGFSLSLLFFMDQNISSALVNTPNNKLKKGAAYHWDLFVVAVINGFLSVFTFPWVHAALPHSPLHVRALADVEERVDQGHIQQM
ncbi:solute carrier family 4 member 11-like isoform X2 [Littorina saxatilis]|uniref:solute carrier family 4 member 11-like isoform X2 n=1 Tax=Littorina saxatilis TaxID=31220 RepID=UPI0038B46FC4